MMKGKERCMLRDKCDDASRDDVSVQRRRDSDIMYCGFEGICTQQESKCYRIMSALKTLREYGDGLILL